MFFLSGMGVDEVCLSSPFEEVPRGTWWVWNKSILYISLYTQKYSKVKYGLNPKEQKVKDTTLEFLHYQNDKGPLCLHIWHATPLTMYVSCQVVLHVPSPWSSVSCRGSLEASGISCWVRANPAQGPQEYNRPTKFKQMFHPVQPAVLSRSSTQCWSKAFLRHLCTLKVHKLSICCRNLQRWLKNKIDSKLDAMVGFISWSTKLPGFQQQQNHHADLQKEHWQELEVPWNVSDWNCA